MVKVLRHTPRVMVIQETSVQPGRDKLLGIFNYAHLYGPWNIHLVHGRSGEQRPRSLNDLRGYDGLIIGQMMLELADVLKRARRPTVLMDPLDETLRLRPRFARLSCTCDDSDQIGKAGAEYFLKLGYTAFAYVGDMLNRNWSIHRGESFRNRIEKAGYACAIYPVPGQSIPGTDDGHALAEWLLSLPKPVALLAAMDTRACQVLELCEAHGIRVPQDIAVLGIDNDELICNGSVPTLSSIRRDTELCGFMAASMLDRLMRRETRKREVFLYGVKEIITRDSTRTCSLSDDPVAKKAREFIRVNACVGIGVPNIVKHLNVSRRLAEIRFQTAYGHSLLDEIQNVRLERVERLLRETDLPLTEICTRCGYSTDVHLRRLFKARFGCPMRDYRKAHSKED
ncbi:MAG TPA: DNA-binding transcriptional regulator [Kiritimatiellia bacterium]|nr:DNA-binding transcriptional regulator [Kiritimatiellia bacterium]HRU70791.1 DNA-binding transcriptional regulator [Kiritimatiellia bacterium]